MLKPAGFASASSGIDASFIGGDIPCEDELAGEEERADQDCIGLGLETRCNVDISEPLVGLRGDATVSPSGHSHSGARPLAPLGLQQAVDQEAEAWAKQWAVGIE